MNLYSPKPSEFYRDRFGTLTASFVESPTAWNLIWLSLPDIEMLHVESVTIQEFVEKFDLAGAGTLRALSTFKSDEGVSIESLMGPSPVRFVQDLQEHFDLPSYPLWDSLGGQVWLDTMLERAYEAEGKSDIFQAAKQSTNVVIADFAARRRVM